MKVLIISPGIYPVPATKGGAVENLIQMLITSREITDKHDVTMYTVHDSKSIENNKKINIEFRYIYTNNFLYKCKKAIRYLINKIMRKYNKYIGNQYICSVIKDMKKENKGYDVIIVENESEYALKLQKIKKSAKIILHLHNDYLNINTPNARQILECYDKVYAISDFLAQRINQIQPKKAKVLYNGIDINRFNIEPKEKKNLKKKYGFNEDEFLFMYSGRLVKEKGVKELIEAFCKVNNKPCKLLIVGKKSNNNNEYYDLLVKTAEKKKNDIIFMGYVDYDKIHEVYSLADVGVVPSICNEAFGLVITEFLASGNPVIVSDKGAMKEIIDTKSGCGKLVEYNKNYIEYLKNAMNYYLGLDKKQLEEIRKKCLDNAKKFSKENYIQNFLRLLEEEEK